MQTARHLDTNAGKSKDIARRAALLAASHFDEVVQSKTRNSSKYALYTWGLLATASLSLGGVLGVTVSLDNKSMIVQPVESVRFAADDTFESFDTAKASNNENTTPTVVETTEIDVKNVDPMTTAALPPSKKPNSLPSELRKEKPAGLLGVQIGESVNLGELKGRFAALDRRAPNLFGTLSAKVQKGNSPNMALVTGPFSGQADAAQFCRTIKLQLTIDCSITPFIGDTLDIK